MLDLHKINETLQEIQDAVREAKCSACNGTGWDQTVTSDEDDRGCDECGGTGEIDDNIDEAGGFDTPEEWQQADAANMRHAKEKLEKLIRELDVFILWRGHNSARFFNNGDRAGTGQLESIVDKLRDMNKTWDKDTSLYGM